ncbi:MAG: hypothetical protein CMN28_14325 [Salinisphaeraceae bacterium]|nr:hypothetical protein [Salinisphaeraceae bacterium]
MLKDTQKKWFGHGVLMMLSTLVFGVGYWMFIVGGFEIIPGYIIEFQLPGSERGWKIMHSAPVLNGLMVIGVALVLPAIDFKEKTAKLLGWLIVGDGWANVLFYIGSNFSDNRALAYSDTHLGAASLWSWIGLAPAAIFGAIAIVVMTIIGWRAVTQPASSQ